MFISLASVSSLSPDRRRRLQLLTVRGSFMTSQVPRLFTSPKLGIIPSFKVSKVVTAVGTYLLTRYFSDQSPPNSRINLSISKDSPKVKHVFDIEDIGTKVVYCRCWRSKKFPYCDGAHSKHNDETGDNIGPLVIKRKGP